MRVFSAHDATACSCTFGRTVSTVSLSFFFDAPFRVLEDAPNQETGEEAKRGPERMATFVGNFTGGLDIPTNRRVLH